MSRGRSVRPRAPSGLCAKIRATWQRTTSPASTTPRLRIIASAAAPAAKPIFDVIFKGRDRFSERTLCNLCDEEAFEAFIGTVSA